MMINNENDNLSRQQISQIIISYLGIKTKNKIYPTTKSVMCHCLFHKDKDPSLGIDIENGRYHCFSCGRGGSIESLYKEVTGTSIYNTLGIHKDPFSSFRVSPLNYYHIDDTEEVHKKSVYLNYDSSKLVSAIENTDCLKFLRKRGISVDLAKKYNFLYCENSRINTTLFKKRLCIPIYEDGILSSIEGRKIIIDEDGPKVLYPKNTSVDTLYDIDNLQKNEDLFACEGLLDLFVMRENPFFNNSTSIFGASLTKRQIQLLKDFKKIIYIPDLDDAGYKTVETLKNSGLNNIYILKLPEEINNFKIKDIGDLPKAGVTITDLLNRKWLNYIKKL